MPYKAYYLGPDGKLQRDLSEEDIRSAFAAKEGLLWVDVRETTEEDDAFLARIFNFHHLAIEDCVSPRLHAAKIDDFDDYLFITVHGVNHRAESDIVEMTEMGIFLGSHFVVSNHNFPLYSVEAVMRQVDDSGRPMKRGADFLAHALIDTLVDNVLPTIDRMGDVAEELEEEVIRHPQQSTLEAIMKLKRSAVRVRRVMTPQREIMNRLSRGEFPIIRQEALVFFRDVYDHVVRIGDMNQALLDRADNALAMYMSSIANRQNETMRVLTIVATIILPLTLLAGIYGMNFENMPELRTSWAYHAVLGFMGAVVFGGICWFWARRWISWGRRRVPGARLFAVEGERIIGYFHQLSKIP
ncbi:MAG: magnesium/cobalt transporter CorA [Dehalococcoidia bacterium]|nr:magnesium/cobalt transporter CorA [Dehalococcoidia bacterium]